MFFVLCSLFFVRFSYFFFSWYCMYYFIHLPHVPFIITIQFLFSSRATGGGVRGVNCDMVIRDYVFKNFKDAMKFIDAVGEEAEREVQDVTRVIKVMSTRTRTPASTPKINTY